MIDSLKKKYFSLEITQQLLIFALSTSLFLALVTLLPLRLYLNHVNLQDGHRLAGIHLANLTQQARQPLVHRDNISLQVIVNNTRQNADYITGLTIRDADGQLLIDSGTDIPLNEDSVLNRQQAIIADEKTLGTAEISLDTTAINPDSGLAWWFGACAWLLFSALTCSVAASYGRHTSRRLKQITASLPTERAGPDYRNELMLLETSIQPLMIRTAPAEPQSQESDETLLILTIRCDNLERLQAQLSQGNFLRQLTELDNIVNAAENLYDARRTTGTDQCLHIEFTTGEDLANAALRAISCFCAITTLLKGGNAGAQFVLCAALAEYRPSSNSTRFIVDREKEAALKSLVSTTSLAGLGQLLITASLAAHASVSTLFEGEPLKSAREQVLFNTLKAAHREQLAAQLSYLRKQSRSAETTTLNAVAS